MKKNGNCFLSLVEIDLYRIGVWDPYSYRDAAQYETMAHFVDVLKVRRASSFIPGFRFSPIEYKHIHRGMIPTFTLEYALSSPGKRIPSVGESCLLFGTMRAYLGNALVTPVASWVGEQAPLRFPVKSEFVQIVPKDGLHYFWWAFLQSPSFLQSLPVGSGDTRPRLLTEQLLRTPIDVPPLRVRERIHRMTLDFAQRQWQGYCEIERLLSSAMW